MIGYIKRVFSSLLNRYIFFIDKIDSKIIYAAKKVFIALTNKLLETINVANFQMHFHPDTETTSPSLEHQFLNDITLILPILSIYSMFTSASSPMDV